MKIQLISICCALLWSTPMLTDNAPHPPVGAQWSARGQSPVYRAKSRVRFLLRRPAKNLARVAVGAGLGRLSSGGFIRLHKNRAVGHHRYRPLADQRLCADHTADSRKEIQHRRHTLENKTINIGDVMVSFCLINGVGCARLEGGFVHHQIEYESP